MTAPGGTPEHRVDLCLANAATLFTGRFTA